MNKEEFLQLLDKYLSGQTTPQEEQMLLSYYYHFQQNGKWDNELVKYMDRLEKEMLAGIKKNIPAHNRAPVSTPVHSISANKKYPLLKWAAAASILLIIGITVYSWSKNAVNDAPQVAKTNTTNDLAPGTQRATLTLNDGTVINLDSSGNGALASQGETEILKTEDGKIIYNTKSGAGEIAMINTMSTPKGGKYQLALPDGSKVWLNSASSITYPTVFNTSQRKVKVTGEAYFEIARNKEKPFIVDVDGKSSVEVLGTSFNINAYEDEEAIKTTLMEGSVKVNSNAAANNAKILTPGQQALLKLNTGNNSPIAIEHNIDIEQVMAWKNGFFQFRNADLKTVMRQLSRWYDVEIVYQGKVPDYRFGGEIPMDALASQVLKVLEKNKIKFKIEGRKIIVGEK